MKFRLLVTLVLLCLNVNIYGQEAPMPNLQEGDKWVYNIKIDQLPQGSMTRKWEFSVVRVSSSSVVVARKPVDSNLPPQESAFANDWSRSTSVNGKITTTLKNFDFPLQVGKKWEVAFTDEKPNDKIRSVKRSFTYKVIGWEEVKVTAGTFKAIKIEADGEWFNEFSPTNIIAGSRVESGATGSSVTMESRNSSTPKSTSGKYYKAIWYAPEVKREVKSVEETFNADSSISNRTTAELDSLQVQR